MIYYINHGTFPTNPTVHPASWDEQDHGKTMSEAGHEAERERKKRILWQDDERKSNRVTYILSHSERGTLEASEEILPLVRNTCNSFDHIKNLHRGIPKPEKNHTGPFSILKRT